MGRTLAGTGVLAAVLGAGLVAGPSGGAPRAIAAACPAGLEQPVGDDRVAYAAHVRTRAVAYRKPGQRPLASFGKLNVNDYPTVLGVLGSVAGKGCKVTWYRVELPMRPNGTIGYVSAADVEVERVETRLEIDLSKRQLTLYRSGRAAMRTTVAIGKAATPTPIGRFYVNQRLRPADPSGPYGPAAIGVSAFSNVLTGWAQGGPIGIHGTNEAWLIGRPVTHGCIRMTNTAIALLYPQVASGTPVIIHP